MHLHYFTEDYRGRAVDAVAYGWKAAVPRLIRELDYDVSNSQISMRARVSADLSVQCMSLTGHVNETPQQHLLIKTEAAKGITVLAHLSKRLQEHLVITLPLACHILP